MKIAFSNIAWSPHDSPAVLRLLREHGVNGIEVAPTRVWPDWSGAAAATARDYRARIEAQGFCIPAMQAVLYGRPDARLFDDAGERALVDHMATVAELAGALGAKAVVFGAPKQRDRGDRSLEAAHAHAEPVFRRLGALFAEHDTCLCIEPNPVRYGCNFVTTAIEAARLVRRVAHPGFALHLDAAALFLSGEKLADVWPSVGELVRHFHISEPDLGDFREPQVPHRENLAMLREAGYVGWCSVEMREPQGDLANVGPWQFTDALAKGDG